MAIHLLTPMHRSAWVSLRPACPRAAFNTNATPFTNTLTKSGFTVNFNISIRVNSCSAGTTIGTVPINYRPASAKSFSTVWRVQSGTSSSTTNANITFNTNGSIVSDTESTGSGSDGGGGKWGSYSITWYTQIVISGSWSTR